MPLAPASAATSSASLPASFFHVTKQCFACAPLEGRDLEHMVASQQRGGSTIWSGEVIIWWDNENNTFADSTYLGRTNPPTSSSWLIGDKISFPHNACPTSARRLQSPESLPMQLPPLPAPRAVTSIAPMTAAPQAVTSNAPTMALAPEAVTSNAPTRTVAPQAVTSNVAEVGSCALPLPPFNALLGTSALLSFALLCLFVAQRTFAMWFLRCLSFLVTAAAFFLFGVALLASPNLAALSDALAPLSSIVPCINIFASAAFSMLVALLLATSTNLSVVYATFGVALGAAIGVLVLPPLGAAIGVLMLLIYTLCSLLVATLLRCSAAPLLPNH